MQCEDWRRPQLSERQHDHRLRAAAVTLIFADLRLGI